MLVTEEKNIEVLGNGIFISPGTKGNFEEQVKSCHKQLDTVMSDLNRQAALVVYFIDVHSREEYIELSSLLRKTHDANYPSPYSIIAQSPVDGTRVNVEVHHCSRRAAPEYLQFEGFNYCRFNYNDNKFVVGGGLQSKQDAGFLEQTRESFRLLKGILNSEGMDLSNIFRQWNYIESITGSLSESQRYQIFNDVRSAFYHESGFKRGYPAATGIGMNTGGVVIDFLAAVHNHVWPVRNPEQVVAYQYSDTVLADNEFTDKFKRTTPKFERAKGIAFEKDILLYVSGTAAIKGEQSLAREDAYQQTLETIDNIERLTAYENLMAHQIPVSDRAAAEPVSFRIYVKSIADVKKVQSALASKFRSGNNVLYLIGDVCRPELLMEMEGTYRLRKN